MYNIALQRRNIILIRIHGNNPWKKKLLDFYFKTIGCFVSQEKIREILVKIQNRFF